MARSRRQQIQAAGGRARRGGGSPASRQGRAEANTEFGSAIHQTRSEAAGSKKRQRDIGSWFAQLSKDYAGAQKQGNKAFATQQASLRSMLGEESGAAASDTAEAAARDAALSKLLGGPTDSSGNATRTAAAKASDQARVTLSQLPASEQANFIAALGGRRTAARLQGIEGRREEGERRTKILSDLKNLKKEKGQAITADTAKARESNRSFGLEKKRFALDRKEAATARQSARASSRLAAIEAQRQREQDAIGNRQEQERIAISRRNAKTSERGSRGGLSPSERRSIKEGKQNATATAASLVHTHGAPRNAQEWGELEEAVRHESGVEAAEARRAVAEIRKRLRAHAAHQAKRAARDPNGPSLGR